MRGCTTGHSRTGAGTRNWELKRLRQVDEFDRPRGGIQAGGGDGKLETAGTGGAGIDVEQTVPFACAGLVGVAADYSTIAGCPRVDRELFEIVNHEYRSGAGGLRQV